MEGATIIDFSQARNRFSRRIAHREQRRREGLRSDFDQITGYAQRERERWLADLETWPRAFQQLRTREERDTEPDQVLDGDYGAASYARCRGDLRERQGFRWAYHDGVRGAVVVLHTCLSKRKEERARGSKAWVTRRTRELPKVKRQLLWTLWLYGKRRIERADFEPHARQELAWVDTIPSRTEKAQEAIREIRARLGRGLYDIGPKKGLPFAPEFRKELARRIAVIEEDIARWERRAEEVQAEPDPLRAWGLYRRPSQARDTAPADQADAR